VKGKSENAFYDRLMESKPIIDKIVGDRDAALEPVRKAMKDIGTAAVELLGREDIDLNLRLTALVHGDPNRYTLSIGDGIWLMSFKLTSGSMWPIEVTSFGINDDYPTRVTDGERLSRMIEELFPYERFKDHLDFVNSCNQGL
jgi:hypothetical protein